MRKHTLLFAALLAASIPAAAQTGVWAYTGGTVHPVSGPPIENGTVIIRGGLIDAVGARVAIPPEATTVDVTGLHVYPGLFDAHARVLVKEPEKSKGPLDGSGIAPPETDASTRVLSMLDWSGGNEARESAYAAGITTARLSLRSRVFDGATPVVNFGSGPLERNVVRDVAAQQISFEPRNDGAYPVSLMGVMAYVRQTLMDAAWQAEALRAYDANPRGQNRPQRRRDLDELLPALQGKLPLVLVADNAQMIDRALRLARENGVARPIISGAIDAWQVAPSLDSRNVSMILSTSYPAAPAEGAAEEPLRLLRRRANAPAAPAELAKRKVRFAFGSHGTKPADFLGGVRRAVRAGLAPEAALRALTLAPAEMFGLDRQLGSLERGKIANVIVTSLPLFEENVELRHVVIDGVPMPLPKKKEEKTDAVSPAAGRWNVSVDTASRQLTFMITIEGSGSDLRGSWSGDAGSGELSSVTLEGETLSFTLTAADQTTGDTSDWKFSGTLAGDSIAGTVSIESAAFRFEGRRQP